MSSFLHDKAAIESLRDFDDFRPDDVILATYPKTGIVTSILYYTHYYNTLIIYSYYIHYTLTTIYSLLYILTTNSLLYTHSIITTIYSI